MEVQFIASLSVIAPDPAESNNLYVGSLGLPLTEADNDGYRHTESLDGAKHFGVWPLTAAAQACFGRDTWPTDRPIPQASVEFEVADADAVRSAAVELASAGHTLLHQARTEPWGQTVARLQSVEGLVIGISYAPWLHS